MSDSPMVEAGFNKLSNEHLEKAMLATYERIRNLREMVKEDSKVIELKAYTKEVYNDPISDLRKTLKLLIRTAERREMKIDFDFGGV